MTALFHTLLYHRSVGKFHYARPQGRGSTYSVGVIGAVDVDCDFVDSTYVRADSQVGTLDLLNYGFCRLMGIAYGLNGLVKSILI